MQVYTQIKKDTYMDSLAALLLSSMMGEEEGIETAYAGMATQGAKNSLRELGMLTEEVMQAGDQDLFLAARASSEEAFLLAAKKAETFAEGSRETMEKKAVYTTIDQAVRANPAANICTIAVPGEYAFETTKQALQNGLHCIVFSNHVPLSEERKMKELAREKGLLCMGPDCGVANINGAAFVLSSINNRGPVGICGASGCGIQHVAAFLHQAGSGVSQTIGTGGNDLKEEVGGITMLMGIDALEQDPDTEFIVLISRKPSDKVCASVLERVKQCSKKVVVCFLGADRKQVEEAGAIYARDLDDCVLKTLQLVGSDFSFESEEEIEQLAEEAVSRMSQEQRYVRGIYCGGTYCDEAMEALKEEIGPVYSNCPLQEEWKLEDSFVSRENCVIDAGEEEFTQGKPHPTLEPSMRLPLIRKEGEDLSTAVILLDFILTPPANSDPAGVTLETLQEAIRKSEERGGRIAVVASVLGTDADLQNVTRQRETLRKAGVYVMKSNRQAAKLAARIIKKKECKLRT